MNMAKSYKFILLITAFIMSLVAAFATMTVSSIKADSSSITPNAYFDYASTTTAKFEENKAVFTLTENDTIKIENTIALNDFFMQYEAVGVKSIKLKTNAESFVVNGNKKDLGNNKFEYHKDITNTVEVDLVNTKATLNGEPLTNVEIGKIFLKETGGKYSASTNDTDYLVENNAYYRIKASNKYNATAGTVEIEIALKDDVKSANFKILSLSQKASDNSFMQSFALTEGELVEAKPVISLADNLKVSDEKVVVYNVKTTIDYKVYSFLDGYTKTGTKIISTDAWVNPNEKGEVQFVAGDNKQLKITDKSKDENVFLQVNVNVLDENAERKNAPTYEDVPNQDALDAFKAALKEKVTAETNGVKHSVALGSTIEIPSLKDFVKDDYTSYENLKVEIKYATPNASDFSTSSEMKININVPGDYLFFVIFKDADGNEIEKSKFITEEEGEEDKINDTSYGANYIFSFTINDDAPIDIKSPTKQGKGFRGTSYTASDFTVEATGCNITYKLYYNSSSEATAESENWVEIPSVSSISDTEYDENGYTYNDIQNIAYNGKLTFTPDKIGSYMIECIVKSKTTSKQETATTIIRVEKEPSTVRPASEWLENNVWSVVFLSVGTLCLIGIIILLCIKPKEEKK